MKEIKLEIPQGLTTALDAQIKACAAHAIQSTLMVTKSKWEQIAQQSLTTTRVDYILGLNADNSYELLDWNTGILTLRGKWPNMLEAGFPAFDMKRGFSQSDRVKQKKGGGWYLTIPFRHRTPSSNTNGSAVGGKVMPTDIYSRARQLRGKERLTGTEDTYPPKRSWTGYQHKAGIYENMIRSNRPNHAHYTTFRRVSNTSDPASWWHPGFSGINAFDQVKPFAEQTVQRVFQDNLKKMLG